MSDDKFYINKPSSSPNEGVRYQEDAKKPSGAATSARSFKRVLDKEDEDRSSAQGKVSEKEDLAEEETSSGVAASTKNKSPQQTKSAKNTASNEEVFSLFGSQKGKAVQKQPSLQAGAEVNEEATVLEEEAEVNGQPKVATNTNADSGTQVRAPKAPKQSQQQSSLETTLAQSAVTGSQEKPKPLVATKEPKSTIPKENPAESEGDSARVSAQGGKNANVQWDDEEASEQQFGHDDLSDASKNNTKLSGEIALAANPNASIQVKREVPVTEAPLFGLNKPSESPIQNQAGNVTQNQTGKETGLKSPPEPYAQTKPKVDENPLAYQRLAATDPAKIAMTRDILRDETVAVAMNENVAPVKSNIANPFPQEQVDLASVNPQALVAPVARVDLNNAITTSVPKPIPSSATMYVLLDVLAKEISTMQAGDKTETTIILQRPPLFANAQVMITGFESAKGQLNITFGNLTQNAQHVIEQQQQSLLLALETKGYQVHIFTATTLELQNPIASAQQSGQEQQQKERDQQQAKNQQQKEREEQREA